MERSSISEPLVHLLFWRQMPPHLHVLNLLIDSKNLINGQIIMVYNVSQQVWHGLLLHSEVLRLPKHSFFFAVLCERVSDSLLNQFLSLLEDPKQVIVSSCQFGKGHSLELVERVHLIGFTFKDANELGLFGIQSFFVRHEVCQSAFNL